MAGAGASSGPAIAGGCGARSDPDRAHRPGLPGEADERLWPRALDRAPQTVDQLDLRFPAEDLAGQRDVWLAHLWIIGRQRLEDDLGLRARHLQHRLGELEQGELVGVADVHRVVVARLREGDDPADEVVDVTEGARLRAVAEHRDRPVLQGL